jgi:6-phosphofructokinase 1
MSNPFQIKLLTPCEFDSPLISRYKVRDDMGILVDATTAGCRACEGGAPNVMELAGPRSRLYFNPGLSSAAIVTCGGLCPGLNDVIRGLTMVLHYRYGVRRVLGLRYGYEGLIDTFGHTPMLLTPDRVADSHQNGGTILGTSRGPQDPRLMTDYLVKAGINMLFVIGGDGTQRGGLDIAREIEKRGLGIAVVGIPKTIDNDISYTERTFGFETAVSMSQQPISGAHMEAKAVYNGVGLVKLMGRESGFVAAYASLASSDVNLVLIPEVPFKMGRLFDFLAGRLKRKSHAVIVVAEGAGQEIISAQGADASGNRKLGDIGLFLKDAITDQFKDWDEPPAVKYIEPSYTIRSSRADADDSVFCFQLAENAVHAAMSGRTAMVVGLWNGHFVHVPMNKAVEARKRIDPDGALWHSVLDNTGQPCLA